MEGSGEDGGIGLRRRRGENQTHDPLIKLHSRLHAKQVRLLLFFYFFFTEWIVMEVEMFL